MIAREGVRCLPLLSCYPCRPYYYSPECCFRAKILDAQRRKSLRHQGLVEAEGGTPEAPLGNPWWSSFRLVDGEEVLRRHVGLEEVGGAEDVAAVAAEGVAVSADFGADLLRRAVGQQMLHVYAAVEGEPTTEVGGGALLPGFRCPIANVFVNP